MPLVELLPLPICELIDQNVVATLQTITLAQSYHFDVTAVERADPNGNQPADLKIVVHVGDDVELPDGENGDTPLGCIAWKRPYWIQVFILKSQSAEVPYEQWKNVVRADIEKALAADPYRGVFAADHQGLAQNTLITDPITFEDANDVRGVFVRIDVIYWTIYGNPYTR